MKKLQVGIVGTGYSAKKRALALQNDSRADLCLVSGGDPQVTFAFGQEFGLKCAPSWLELVNHPDLDLIFICTINQLHFEVAKASLEGGKNVVVEYPLALNSFEAEELINLARKQNKLLHIEHIELLGGVHQAIAHHLPELGKIFYTRYVTFFPQNPAPHNWKYHYQNFGPPLIAALSRIQRLTALFGEVKEVRGKTRYWQSSAPNYFRACLAEAQLEFNEGLRANVIYGKGEVFYRRERLFEVYGEQGKMIFEDQKGLLITKDEEKELIVKERQGLFAEDTKLVLDYLIEGKPLYIDNRASYYALKIADVASNNLHSQIS